MQPSSDSATGMPQPDAASQRHCERMVASLRELIAASGGSISFGEYMHHVLYAPGLGYYAAGARKFGAAGDFVTAPEVSPLFGRVVGRQCAAALRQLGGGSVLEFGAGSGALAVQVIEALARDDCLPERYQLLEVSADLRDRQQRLIEDSLPALAERVQWLDRVPENFRGVVLANEVADALPVERFRKSVGGVEQCRVAANDGRFVWQHREAPAWLASAVTQIEQSLGQPLPPGYESELSPGLAGWIAQIGAGLDAALVLLFDYGVSRREYYAAERSGGWLRCHFRHRAHNDPFVYPGIQDLTAWVDFTAVAEAAVAAGLDVEAYLSQAHFLLHGGLAEELDTMRKTDARSQHELSRQVKMLTLPGEMGEHFKCMALVKGDLGLPDALRRADRSHTL